MTIHHLSNWLESKPPSVVAAACCVRNTGFNVTASNTEPGIQSHRDASRSLSHHPPCRKHELAHALCLSGSFHRTISHRLHIFFRSILAIAAACRHLVPPRHHPCPIWMHAHFIRTSMIEIPALASVSAVRGLHQKVWTIFLTAREESDGMRNVQFWISRSLACLAYVGATNNFNANNLEYELPYEVKHDSKPS